MLLNLMPAPRASFWAASVIVIVGLGVPSAVLAHEGRGAPITYANANLSPVPSPTGDAPAASPNRSPRLSYRYPDQPDRLYGARAVSGRSGPAPIDLRGAAPMTAPAGAVGRAFDARAVAAETEAEDQAPAAPPGAPAATSQGAQPWLERERVGAPYQVNGRTYVPTPEPGYAQVGKASWYGAAFEGKRTANGEIYRADMMTAAHPTLPIPSLVQVTNLENGREVILRVNDRGPFARGRLLDVSRRAAQVLGFEAQGSARVHVRYLGPAPKRVSAADAAQATDQGIPEDMEAEAPAPAPAASPRGVTPPATQTGYVVQVGAYGDVANAERARAQVRDQGIVSIDRRQTGSLTLHRVRVGPWQNLADAERSRAEIEARGFDGAVVAALR